MCCVRNTLLDELLNQFDAPMRVRIWDDGECAAEISWENIRENAPSHVEKKKKQKALRNNHIIPAPRDCFAGK